MKKLITLLLAVFSFLNYYSQTQVNIGPQSSTFTSWVRGYHFTSPVTFTICGLYVPPDASTAAQNVAVVRFTAGAPPAFAATTNAFVSLFNQASWAPNSMIPCNIVVNAGDIIGVYGSRGPTCINSYDGANFATTIMGFPTTLRRSGMQQCLAATPMANIWSEVNFSCGRIFMYYNCCAVPTVTASATPTSVCSGMNVALLGGGASTYTWTPGNLVGANVNVTPSVTTNYTVVGTSTAGCNGSTTVNVTVNPNPTVTAVAVPTSVCVGKPASLTAGGAATYTWNPGNIVGAAVSVTPASTTIYTVTGSSVAGCSRTQTVSVTVNPLPVVVPGSNSPVCLGGNLNLSVGAATTYSWSGPNAFTSNLQNPTIANATAAMSGVYTVSVTNANGCVSSNTISVVINPLPTINPLNTGPYCVGATINLSTPAATSFTWTGPNVFSSNLQNPTVTNAQLVNAGIYSVSVTSAGGCISSGTTNVVVNALPVPVAANSGPYCPGNTIQLNVGAFTTYTWSGPSSFNSNLQNASVSSASVVNGGVYTVSVTNANGCINSSTTNVVVNPSPVVVIGSNSPVCLNANLNLNSAGGTSYSWSGPNSFSSVLQNPNINGVTSVNSGVYTVTVTTLGCSSTGTTSVSVLTPTTSASNTGAYCSGATIQLNTPAANTYTWSGPGGFTSNLQNPTIPSSNTGMSGSYNVIVSVGTCTANASTNVVVNALPVPVAANSGPYCPGNTIQLNVGAFSTYTWSGPSSFNSNLQNASVPSASVTNGGIYTVSVTNANGCVNSSTTNVVVNPSPVVVIGSNSPVCLNANLNLNAAGGTTYSWSGPNSFSSALQNPNINGVTSANAGVYTVTVTSLGCSSTGTTNVSVLTPTTTASNTGAYCAGATIQLNTPAANTYTWSGPGGFTSNLQSPTIPSSNTGMSGTYSVIVSVGTCTANASTNVVVNALPTPTAQSNSPVCVANAINLIGSGGLTYTWTGPGGFTSNQQNPVIPNCGMTNAGTNTLTVTDANGCTNTAIVNVVVNPLPVIVVNNPTVCVNQGINFTATGGSTYNWSGPAGFTSTLQNPNIPSATMSMGGAYSVTVTTAAGCSSVSVSNAQVLALPNPQILSNSPVCAGNTLNLMGSGGATYTWTGPGYNGNLQNPVINNVTSVAGGVYTLLAASGTCTASTTYTVVINPIPVLNVTSTNVLCNGQNNGTAGVNVSVGTSPFTYTWNTSPIQNVQNATSLPAGNYSVTVTDANGCSSVTGTQITQPNQFVVSVNSAVTSACSGNPINVNASGSGGIAPYNYNWVSGPSGSSYSINEAVSGNYTYTVNATDANNCPATAFINLTFAPQPTVIATSATLCAGQTANLTASGANTYVWQPGNVTGNTYPFNGNTSTNITVIGTSNGCSNSANTNVIVNPAPNATITTSGAKGCVPVCVSYTASGSSNIVNYGWTVNGAGISSLQNGTHCFNEAASYSLGLTVTDNNGCTTNVSPTVIDVYASPVADFNNSPLKPIVNQDQVVTFTDASHGPTIVSWNWYFMNTAQYTSNVQNPTFTYTEPGTYAVALVVKSENGCTDTIVKQLIVGEDFGLYVPNAFTPNEDGLNDVFQPKGFGIVKYQLQIFDRWGERVFETKSFDHGWDGKFRSKGTDYEKICQEGVYSWLINVTNVFGKASELKGHVTLIK